LPGVLARVFVLKNLDGIDDFAKTSGRCVGESAMKALYSLFKDLLEEDDVDGWGLLC